ncbi:hypothetical protein D9756_006860 [Leucocoprinus leucothites]|uniref:Ricin B lectin domain-containing protein n=1 Tax=Leucocoprinus leucothites TaxID=201217 RepID=A0A8H5G2M6_9AGAR|nr:hypothetical protein D9756_006860 [Leucoagaricus leucothites]
MQSKLLTLFGLAALATAQQAPFQIISAAEPSLHIAVQGDSTDPGAPIVVTSEFVQSQNWTYNTTTGYIINVNSGTKALLLTGGKEGDPSVTLEKMETEPDDLNQIWVYNQTLITLQDTGFCLTHNGSSVVMMECDGSEDQTWNLDPSPFDQQ